MSRWAIRAVATLYVALLVGLPVGAVVFRALRPGISEFWSQVSAPPAVHALLLTLGLGAIAVALNTAFGLAAALVLARHRFPGASFVEALIDVPLAISPVVVGLALLLCYSSTEGLLGPFLSRHGVEVLFAYPAIVMASAFVSLPYVVREVQPVLIELGTDEEEAAATLGAGALTTFWRVTLPSIRWALAYGVLLTTARVLGEFGAVAVVSGNILDKTQTLTLYVDYDFSNFDAAGAYAGALILGLISIGVLGALSISRSRQKAAR
jgi:sulfate/thiosulfate transport system permease protein